MAFTKTPTPLSAHAQLTVYSETSLQFKNAHHAYNLMAYLHLYKPVAVVISFCPVGEHYPIFCLNHLNKWCLLKHFNTVFVGFG